MHHEPSSDFADKKDRIKDVISKGIGNKLWDFGNKLGLKLGRLDAINKEQIGVARKVDQIFEEFEKERYNDVTYIDKVSTALEKAKRKEYMKLWNDEFQNKLVFFRSKVGAF